MRVNRDKLLESIYSFSTEGSGLIVGKPGIGKSHLLRQLHDLYKSKNILAFIVRIDNAFDASDSAIATEIGLKGDDWVETLGKVKLPDERKAILIFDAFDAARDEAKRNGFLKQIKRAKSLLSGKWHIMVSVRTYDADKSEELSRLFYTSSTITRRITVNELTAQEISESEFDHPGVVQFYQSSSDALKGILSVPFFLHLLENILADSSAEELQEIKLVKSETQLLTTFWKRKIIEKSDHLKLENFLRSLTNELVSNRTLSISKATLFQKDEKVESNVFDYLRSEDIIDELSFNHSRISFSHNILFDFAVSWFLLSDNYPELLSFINTDRSRAFFFRPSFIYFFTSLWYVDKPKFWKLFNDLAKNEEKEIKLFVRLILNTIIAAEYSHVNELQSILAAQNNVERADYTRNFLQSIRFISPVSRSRDVQLLVYLSDRLNVPFLFDFAFLLERAINDNIDTHLDALGGAARNLIRYVFQQRHVPSFKIYVDRIGFSRAVELVAKTFRSDTAESSAVLSEVLEMVNQNYFEIYYASSLADSLKYILPYDAAFVAKVYQVFFGHDETSDQKTTMGSSVVMNFISNRRQDYDLVLYRLQTFFPEFISVSPVLALKTGLIIVNQWVSNHKQSVRTKTPITFQVDGNNYSFVDDLSIIWGKTRQYSDKGQEIGYYIVDYIETLVESGDIEHAKLLIRNYALEAKVGFLWKLLLQLISKFPSLLVKDFLSLILAPPIFTSSNTSFEVRDIIGKSSELMDDSDILKIERAAFKHFLPDREYAIHAMLSMLPTERLQLAESRRFMSERKVIQNAPAFTSTTSVSDHTTREWLTDLGVDLTTPSHSKLMAAVNELNAFNQQFLNGIPSTEQFGEIAALLRQTFLSLLKQNELPDELVITAFSSIAKTAAISSRIVKELAEDDYQLLKEIIIYCFKVVSKYDIEDSSASPARGYSPTPRIEAAEALIHLFLYKNDIAILDLINSGVNEKNGVVRFNVIRHLRLLACHHENIYREILFHRILEESDPFTNTVLLSLIEFKKDSVIDDAIFVIDAINKKENLFTADNQFLTSYSEFLLWCLNKGVPGAQDTLLNAYTHDSFCNAVIFSLFNSISPSDFSGDQISGNPQLSRKIHIIDYYVSRAGKQLTTTQIKPLGLENPIAKKAIGIIDEIIIRIYFCLESREGAPGMFLTNEESSRQEFYFHIKPIYEGILKYSSQIEDGGLMIGHTAHYFIQSLNSLLSLDPKDILAMVAKISLFSVRTGYSLDSMAMRDIVNLTERLLADHRELLLNDESFQDLISILDIYINSGWVDALELLWKLDEIFR